MNGLSPSDAGDNFTTRAFSIVKWDAFTLEWKELFSNYSWEDAVLELESLRDGRGAYRVVRVEKIVTHTDMTVLADRELGI